MVKRCRRTYRNGPFLNIFVSYANVIAQSWLQNAPSMCEVLIRCHSQLLMNKSNGSLNQGLPIPGLRLSTNVTMFSRFDMPLFLSLFYIFISAISFPNFPVSFITLRWMVHFRPEIIMNCKEFKSSVSFGMPSLSIYSHGDRYI